MPPIKDDSQDAATKSDINQLRAETKTLGTELRGEMTTLRSDVADFVHGAEQRITEAMVTKVELKKLFDTIDTFMGEVKESRRDRATQGNQLLRIASAVDNHEGRLRVLESDQ